MAIEKKEIEFTKELDDVGVLIVELVAAVKQGKELSSVVDELVNAINGVDQLDDELAAHRGVALQTLGYRLGELTDVLLTPKAVKEVL